MSIKNHPNFHAVKFVVEVVSAFHEETNDVEKRITDAFVASLRGKANSSNVQIPENVIHSFVYGHPASPSREETVEFVSRIEDGVDAIVENMPYSNFTASSQADHTMSILKQELDKK